MRKHRAQWPMLLFGHVKNDFALLVLQLAWIVVTGWVPAAVAQNNPTMKPDLGPNMLIFDPTMPQVDMQQQIDKIYEVERRNEFGPERYAILFLPGKYHLDVPVGFYTHILGLGATPDAVHIVGNIHAEASHDNKMQRRPSGARLRDVRRAGRSQRRFRKSAAVVFAQ